MGGFCQVEDVHAGYLHGILPVERDLQVMVPRWETLRRGINHARS